MADYRAIAREKAAKYSIDEDIYERQIEAESNFNPKAYNASSGASGIAQIMPQYHDVDVWDAEASLDYGANIMSQWLRYFGSYPQALAAYNWGPGNVKGWDGRKASLPKETQQYLTKILGEEWYDPLAEVFEGVYAFPIVGWNGKVNNHWGTSERGGSDIFGERGSDVIAVRGGKVSYAGYDPTGGNNVLIDGDDGRTQYYAHLDAKPSVKTGQTVKTGEYLGPLGDSGNAKGTGPHLHIGIGYGIVNGSGPSGGCGINFDAVGLLQDILDGRVGGEDMARIADLEAEVANLNAQLENERSWAGSAIEDTLKPSIDQLESVGDNDDKGVILDTVSQVSGNLRKLAYGEE